MSIPYPMVKKEIALRSAQLAGTSQSTLETAYGAFTLDGAEIPALRRLLQLFKFSHSSYGSAKRLPSFPIVFRIGFVAWSMRASFHSGEQRQRTLHTPPVTVYAISDSFATNPRDFSPFIETQCLTKSLYIAIVTRMAILYLLRGPHKIAFLVMSIIVDTVYGVFWRRSAAHLRQELKIRVKAKFNTTAAISVVTLVLRIITTSLCTVVGLVFWRIVSTNGFSMNKSRVLCSRMISSHWIKDNSFVNLVRSLWGDSYPTSSAVIIT